MISKAFSRLGCLGTLLHGRVFGVGFPRRSAVVNDSATASAAEPKSLCASYGATILALGLALAGALASGATHPTSWDCGGEGERPCSSETDFFWENGNLFADRGLQAQGFRVLGPVKFNGTDWINLNRADMTAMADLVKVQLPRLENRLNQLSVSDFTRAVCVGITVDGKCYSLPPVPEIGFEGTPSFEFDYFPDFSKSGWTIVDDIGAFLSKAGNIIEKFPPVIKGIPGDAPTLHFKKPTLDNPLDIASFERSVQGLKRFIADASFFSQFRNLVLDFTDPPPGAICVNATRRQAEPETFRSTWAWWAFRQQRELAKDEPMNWSTLLSAHNAYNNEADGYIAANQKWSFTDLLNLGARQVDLDLHWFKEGNGKIRLSHATGNHEGASSLDRYYPNALKEIARWLKDNPTEVVWIGLEDRTETRDSETGKVVDRAPDAAVIDPLEKYLGHLIYRCTEGNRPWRNNGYDPIGQWPSLQEMRDLGKRVIVTGDKDHGTNLIWTSYPQPTGELGARQAKNFTQDVANLVAIATWDGTHRYVIGPFVDNKIGTQYESRSFLDPFDAAGFLTAKGIVDRQPYSISHISLDMMHAQQYSSQCPEAGPEVCGAPDQRIAAMVWSWAEGQPEDFKGGADNGEDAAMVDGVTGRWVSRNPSEVHYFAACRKRGLDPIDLPDRAGVDWRITEIAGAWSEAEAAVAALNRQLLGNGIDDDCDGRVDDADEGSYVFGAPANGAQNARLKRALEAFGARNNLSGPHVWIACHDRVTPGQWMISRSFPEDDPAQHGSTLSFDAVNQRARLPFPTSSFPVPPGGWGQEQDAYAGEITIEFWQKAAERRQQFTLSVTPDEVSNRIGIHSPWVDGNVYWDFGDIRGAGRGRLAYRPPVEIIGTWQHFAMVAGRGGMKIFRNGVEEAAKKESSGFSWPKFNPQVFMSLGSGGSIDKASEFFKGQLDNVRIWSVARTASQIRQTMFQRVVSHFEVGLVANWALDEERGNVVYSFSLPQLPPGELINGPTWTTWKPALSDALSHSLIAASPLVYYRLDETTNCSVVVDSSGHALHGGNLGAAMGLPGASAHLGRSVRLSSLGGGVQLPNLGKLNQFTLSVLVKRNRSSWDTMLLGGPDKTVGVPFISLSSEGDLEVGFCSECTNNSESERVVVKGALSEPDVWRLATVVYDPTLSANSDSHLKVFVDGNLAASRRITKLEPAVFTNFRLGLVPPEMPFVLRGAAGDQGTATVGGVTFDSRPDNRTAGGEPSVKAVGTQPDVGPRWRTPSFPKSLDLDGDHVLGTDGYQIVNAHPVLPSYVQQAKILSGIYPGNEDYARIDSPKPGGPSLLTGTMNPAPPVGQLADLFSFTLKRAGASGRTIRVGLLVDNLDIPGLNASSLSLRLAGSSDASAAVVATRSPVLNNRVPDWLFFDISGVGSNSVADLDEFVVYPRAFSDAEVHALSLNTPQGRFHSITPAPNQLEVPSDLVEVIHSQGSVEWDLTRVELKLDGTRVPATIRRQNKTVVVTYQPSLPFAGGSKHVAALTYPVSAERVRTLTWEFTKKHDQRYSIDAVAARRGDFTGAARFTADAGGRTGARGDFAVDLGTTQTGQSIHIRDAAFLNEAAAKDEMAISGWQKLYSIAPSSFFWGVSPSSSGGNRGWGTHAPWPDRGIYFDTAGCCNPSQRLVTHYLEELQLFIPNINDPGFWNNWHHLVFQKRGGIKEIWLDGFVIAREDGAAPLPTDFTEAYFGLDLAGGGSVQGLVDDVAVFGSSLDGGMIQALRSGVPATTLAQHSPQTKLLAYWDFNGSTPPPVSPPRIDQVAIVAGRFQLSWSGGAGPFTVQRKENSVDSTWTTLTTTSSSSVEVPANGRSAFFRVLSQ